MDLCDHQFLSFFPAADRARLAKEAKLCSLEPNELLLREGDPSDRLYLILEGTASIQKRDASGKSTFLGYIQMNDFVGEFGIIDNAPRSADVQAVTPLHVASIPRETILDCLHDPAALFRLTAHTIHRMRTANQLHVEALLKQERMGLIGQMMSGILHDFRNPFAVISMASECILQDSPEAAPYCELISQQINRMTGMAEDILNFSSGKMVLHPAPILLDDLFEQFHKLYADYFAQMEVELHIEPSGSTFSGDADKLMRVLQNLTNNAAQAMATSGGSITLSAEHTPEQIVLHVADDGPGIPEELRYSLFDAFATKGKKNGLGLGLAVTQSIVDAHGGHISFDTEPGGGTTFHIVLPA